MDETQNQLQDTSTQDVNSNADMSTAGGSSPDTQQTSDAQSTNDNSGQTNDNGQTDASDTLADGTSPDKQVPFSRLQSEIEKRAAAEERLRMLEQRQQNAPTQQQKQQLAPEVQQAREQLKALLKDLAPELGFVSKAEIQQQQQFQQVQTTHDKLSSMYDGKKAVNGVIMPKYDAKAVHDFALKMGYTRPEHLEVAYKQMHEAEIMDARIQAAMSKSRGVQSERSNGTGSANTGVSNDDLKKAAQSGDKQAINVLLKRRLFSKPA